MPGHELWLREDFQQCWRHHDPFAAAFAIRGETYRALEQRQTLAFEVDAKRYFIKRHRGTTWSEIVKNLLQLRLPVVSASNEYRAITRLTSAGITTPVVAAYGKRGWLPSTFESFLITEDVGAHQSLEDHCRTWPQQAPVFAEKQVLLQRVADIARTMHVAGVCHRDFYLCHLLLVNSSSGLTVIDLHRALIKHNPRRRWIIKDVAGLYFSAMDIGLTQRDIWRFMMRYHNCSLRQTLQRDKRFWLAVDKRARRMYERDKRAR